MRLYELTSDLVALQELLEDSLEDEQLLLDTLEAVQGEYDAKMEAYAKVVKNLEADMEALKTEAKRLTDKRKVLENNVSRLKSAMYESLKATGKTKAGGQVFTVAIQKNGGKLPVIVDVDVSELPDECVKVVESPDLEAIGKLLDAGKCLFAHYGERGESLRIK